ncbi:MAG TPA: preprotein translocase subunit SecE [Rhodothermales bacterium]|nr:preprotein translocase subunit SecE [Rhodothermales bacterium]
MATQTSTPARPGARTPDKTAPATGERAGNYLTEVQKEMRKVSWPKRQELINNTVLTLAAALVLSLLIFGADQVISRVLAFIYGG